MPTGRPWYCSLGSDGVTCARRPSRGPGARCPGRIRAAMHKRGRLVASVAVAEARRVARLPSAPRRAFVRRSGAVRRARPRSAAARSPGSGHATSTSAPVTGCVERQPRGVQELALEAEQPGACRTRDRRRPGWPIASRCTRIWWVRPVSSARAAASCAGSASSISKCVTRLARRRRCRSTCACARGGRGRSARRSCPLRAGGRPSTSARYSRVIVARCSASLSARWTASDARDDEQPGRVAVEAVDDARAPAVLPARGDARQRLRERARPVPARRDGRRRPAGLSTTSRCSSS